MSLRSFSFSLTCLLGLSQWLIAGELARGPYLQLSTSDSVVVVWRTAGKSAPSVRYGPSPSNLLNTLGEVAIVQRISIDVDGPNAVPRLYKEPVEELAHRESNHDPSTAPNTRQFEARISGLNPDSKYYYAIYDGDRRLAGGDENHYFKTHHRIGTTADLRIWVVGDSGTGGVDQARVHDAMRAYVNRTGRDLDHYIHVGDMAYRDGTDREFQDNFFAPYQRTLRNTVCWPAMGNHEGHTSRGISGIGPYYDAYVLPTKGEAGGTASGTEAYYSFDIDDAHFICLDSHDLDRSPNAAMAQWLRADLEQTHAKWLVAFWHHPPYTKGSHDSDLENQLIEMRENFMPILESGGVDITLSGHSHIYERSMLMDGAYSTPTTSKGVILDDGDGRIGGDGAYRKSKGLKPHQGSVSIVAGHGGTGLGRSGTLPVMREIILENGSVLLDIQGDTLTGTMLNKDGQIRDSFSLVKRGNVRPVRVKNPWQPLHDISLLTEYRLDFNDDALNAAPKGWKVESGNESGLKVVNNRGSSGKLLRAESTDKPLIGLYSQFTSPAFEFGTRVRLPKTNGHGIGLIFHYQDPENFSLVFLDPVANAIRLSRFVNGKEQVIREEKSSIFKEEWLNAEYETAIGEIEVKFQDDEERLTELEFVNPVDAKATTSPGGIYLPPNSSAEFLYFGFEDKSRE